MQYNFYIFVNNTYGLEVTTPKIMASIILQSVENLVYKDTSEGGIWDFVNKK